MMTEYGNDFSGPGTKAGAGIGSGWTLYQDLPNPVYDHCMVMLNGSTVAVIGGRNSTSVTADVFYMNLKNPG